MGASLIHGQRLFKQRVRYPDETEADELSAEGGGWESPSYSSVSHMMAFCEARGVSEGDWPIYYDIWQGDANLVEIARRCEQLRQGLLRLNEAECASVPWLGAVRRWLAEGQVFAVFE